MRKVIAPLLLVFVLTACESIGIPSPDTPAEKLVAAEASFTAAVKSAKAAYDAGVMDESIASYVDIAVEGGNTALNIAQEFLAEGKPKAAEEWILKALSHVGDINRLVAEAQEVT